jgi:hypothetical protein
MFVQFIELHTWRYTGYDRVHGSFCELLIKNSEVSSDKYFYRNIKNIDIGSLAFDALHNIPWSHTGHIDSIDDKVNFLMNA